MFGWILRANSSNTRCWYCISVPNLAAWNRRSPSQIKRDLPGRWTSPRRVSHRSTASVGSTPLLDEGIVAGRQHHGLGVLDEPVVLGVEHVVDGGQADILVGAAVAGDEVRVEQFVVVGRRSARCPGCRGRFRCRRRRDPSGTALCAMSARKAWPVRIGSWRDEDVVRQAGDTVHRRSDCRRPAPVVVTICGKPFGAADEVAVLIGREQRHVADVGVEQLDAEHVRGLRLQVGPGRHAAIAALDQLAGRDRIAGGVEHVLAQEHLVRRVRGIGLVLVDERGRGVDRAIGVVGGRCPIDRRRRPARPAWRGSAP